MSSRLSSRKRGRKLWRRTVHDLPDECVARVLSHLHYPSDRNAASLVCRRWRSLEALSRHSLKVQLEDHQWSATEWSHCLRDALHTFPNILTIEISGDDQCLPGPFLSGFRGKQFTQIRTLCLRYVWNIDDKFMACLAKGCPVLTHLELRKVKPEGSVTDVGIELLLAGCPNMEQMIICMSWHGKGWGFRQGKQLKRLEVMHGYGMDDALAEGLQGLTSLETLEFPGMGFACRDLTFLGECCKRIDVLNLFACYTLNDLSLEAIVSGCKNLRELDVRDCWKLDLDGWKALAREAINLEVLDVSGCLFHSDGLRAIQSGCPALCSHTDSKCDGLSSFQIGLFQHARPSVRVYIKLPNGAALPFALSQLENAIVSLDSKLNALKRVYYGDDYDDDEDDL